MNETEQPKKSAGERFYELYYKRMCESNIVSVPWIHRSPEYRAAYEAAVCEFLAEHEQEQADPAAKPKTLDDVFELLEGMRGTLCSIDDAVDSIYHNVI